jgi:hypothetical protein
VEKKTPEATTEGRSGAVTSRDEKRGQAHQVGLAFKTMFFVSRYFLAIRTCSMEAGPRASSTSFFGVLGAR